MSKTDRYTPGRGNPYVKMKDFEVPWRVRRLRKTEWTEHAEGLTQPDGEL